MIEYESDCLHEGPNWDGHLGGLSKESYLFEFQRKPWKTPNNWVDKCDSFECRKIHFKKIHVEIKSV